MKLPAVVAHSFVVMATLAGIIGFGLMYNGIAHHQGLSISVGAPLLFSGLWWVGRDLARSNLAARRRRLLRSGSDPRGG
jgi:hypothetical protein